MAHAGERASTNRRRWFLAALVGACLMVYLPGLGGAFVFDDASFINTASTDRLIYEPQRWLQVNRSLAVLSFSLNRALLGDDPAGYRLVNIAIHALAGLTLFATLRRLLSHGPANSPRAFSSGRAETLAFAASLLWLVHPLNTQAVTYIVQRMESLAGLCYLLALYFVIRSAETGEASAGSAPATQRRASPLDRSWVWGVLAILAALLGMGSKPILVTAPVVLLIVDRLMLAGSWRVALRQRGWVYGLMLVGCLGLAMWSLGPTLLAQADPEGQRGPTVGFGLRRIDPWRYAQLQVGVVAHYLFQAIWPQRLSLDWYYTGAGPIGSGRWLWAVAAPALLILPLLGLSLWGVLSGRRWGALGAWFFLILAPTSSIVPTTDLIVEHRMYLPLISLSVLVALGVDGGLQRLGQRLNWPGPRRSGLAVTLLLLAATALSLRSMARNRDYATTVDLWQATLRVEPDNPRAQINLARAYLAEDRTQRALEQFLNVARLLPQHAIPPRMETAESIGRCYLLLNRYEPAALWLGRASDLAEQLKRPRTDLRKLLAYAQLRAGQYEAARGNYQRLLSQNPQDVAALTHLGLIHLRLNQPELARRWLKRALAVDPNARQARRLLVLIEQAPAER